MFVAAAAAAFVAVAVVAAPAAAVAAAAAAAAAIGCHTPFACTKGSMCALELSQTLRPILS